MGQYLSTKELAGHLGTHINTVRRWTGEHILDEAIIRASRLSHPRYFLPAVLHILKQRGISFPGVSSGDNQPKK